METESRLNIAIQSAHPLRKDRPDGVKDVITTIRPYLRRKGCEVTIIGPSMWSRRENNLADFTFGGFLSLPVTHDDTKRQMVIALSGKGRAEKLIRRIRPDIFVVHEPFAGHMAHPLISGSPRRKDGKKVPVILGHFHAQTEYIGLLARVGKAMAHATGYDTRVADALDGRIAVSKATASFWQEQIGGEFEVIYNGVNTEELTPYGPRIEAWNDGRKTILAAARHDPRKGLEYGIRAIGLLVNEKGRKDIKLKVTGKGQETYKLKALVKELGLENFVEFLGILDRKTLAMEYRTASVFISPATGGEGFGRTLTEAMSSGALVVASDINGYREVMQGKPFTKMVQPRNPGLIAAAISEFLDLSQEAGQKLKKEARKHVLDNFDLEDIANQTVRYYESRLSLHGRPTQEDWDFGRKRKLPTFGIIFKH